MRIFTISRPRSPAARLARVVLVLVAACFVSVGAAQSAPSGTLRIAVGEEPATLDPHFAADNQTYQIQPLVHDGLVVVDADGGLKPLLAESWSSENDAQVWTFMLKQGALFHDGSEVTAEDVRYSLLRDQDENLDISRRLLGIVSSIEAVDRYTVRIRLNEPYQPFLALLATKAGYIIPMAYAQEVGPDGFAAAPIGAGPLRVESFMPGIGMDLVRFDDYHLGTPGVERVEVRVVPETSTQVSQLLSNAVDVIDLVTADNLELLRSRGMTVQGADAAYTLSLIQINAAQSDEDVGPTGRLSPLRDIRVRRAVAMCVDWDLIVDTFRPDPLGKRALGYYPPAYEGLPSPEYDPEAARELLDEAGYADGMELEIITLSDRDIALEMQNQLGECNIDAYITIIAGSEMYPKIFDTNFDLFASSWSGGGTPSSWVFLNQFFSSSNFGAPGNRSRLAHPDIDALLNEAVREADETRQEALFQQIQELAWDELLTIIPLAGKTWPAAWNPDRVTDYRPHPQGNVTIMGPSYTTTVD